MVRLFGGLIVLLITFAIGFMVYSQFLSRVEVALPNPSVPIENLNSGITGKIFLGPQCPTENQDDDLTCEPKPYQTTIVVKTIDGRKVTEFNSDVDGKFEVKLAPGKYWLEAADQSELPYLTPTPVDVEANKFKEVILRFDTGIR